MKSLGIYPDSGRMVPELQREDVREVIIDPYRVMSRRRADATEIVAILHGSREFDADGIAP